MNNIIVHELTSNSATARLYRFGINSAELSLGHKEWLNSYILPVLSNGGFVFVIGEASRTGKKSLNKKLSQRRAQSVITYLRIGVHQMGINVNFRTQFSEVGDKKTSFLGAGEFLAELSGIANKTENGFYRAATVTASLAPLKQSPRKPSRTFIKRVVERRWSTVSDSVLGGEPGAKGAALGGLAKEIYLRKTRGGSDTRKYLMTPNHYLVNEITYELHFQVLRTGPVTTKRTVETYTYKWGIPKKTVIFHDITSGDEVANTSSHTTYFRDHVWKHVTTPYVP